MFIKRILFSAIILSSFFAQSQQIAVQLPTQYIQNQHMGNNDIPADVVGTPFLNDQFEPGKVMVNEKEFSKLLRYNAYSDIIEMQIAENEISGLIKRANVDARIGDKTFRLVTYETKKGKTQNYGIALSDGEHAALYKVHQKELIPGKPAESSYTKDKPARFNDREFFLLESKNQEAQMVKLKKNDFLKTLKDQSDALESFIAENKLKMKSEGDFVRLVEFYNTL